MPKPGHSEPQPLLVFPRRGYGAVHLRLGETTDSAMRDAWRGLRVGTGRSCGAEDGRVLPEAAMELAGGASGTGDRLNLWLTPPSRTDTQSSEATMSERKPTTGTTGK